MTSTDELGHRGVPGHDRDPVDLAVATRMLVHAGILGYSGHLSARSPDGTSLLVQPVNDVRADLKPERILVLSMDGEVISGDGRPPSEWPIHTEIYRARPDVGAVAHFHHDPTTVFSMVEDLSIVPVKNHASRWASGVPVHPDPSHISTVEQGSALAATLGSCNAMLLRAHGEVVAAESVRCLFADVVHFVENATALAAALQLGRVSALSGDEIEVFQSDFERSRHAEKLWKYHEYLAVRDGAVPAEWAAGGSGRRPRPDVLDAGDDAML